MTVNDLREAEITSRAKLETIRQIAKFINDGGGTFRVFAAAVGLGYTECYKAGGMLISNTIDQALHGPLPEEDS